jgi:hypothetical protein
MTRAAGLLLCLAGCARIFGLEDHRDDASVHDSAAIDMAPPQDVAPGATCVSDSDDPLRYRPVVSSLTFQTAASKCHELDMIPVVFTSSDELVAHRTDVAAAFWTGLAIESDLTVDGLPGCNVFTNFASGQPDGMGACVIVDSQFEFEARACDAQNANVLCETPPRVGTCVDVAMSHPSTDYTVLDKAVKKDDAATMCQVMGMHLISLDSSAELALAKALVAGVGFWTASEWNGTDWVQSPAPGSCPMVHEWATGQPSLQAARSCEAHDPMGAVMIDCNMAREAICEGNGH